MKSLNGLCLGLVSVLLAACSGPGPQQAADAVYSGGDILTMAGDQPQYVEALAVKDGRIVLAGSLADAKKLTGKTTQQVNLNGRTVLPRLYRCAWPHCRLHQFLGQARLKSAAGGRHPQHRRHQDQGRQILGR